MSAQYPIPTTPRVISPSPTPSESAGRDGYFAPTTRSKTAAGRASIESIEEDAHPDVRARSRSRSPIINRKSSGMAMNGSMTNTATVQLPPTATSPTTRRRRDEKTTAATNGHIASKPPQANGLLSPESAYPEGKGFGSSYWRNLSRSPSPLGLIPIHREWRAFVHKHEVPRKVLHVSIAFLTLGLYRAGYESSDIHPVLLSLLIPIFSVDVVRFQWPAFNKLYIKVLGPFMRESEAHDRFNGVISYLAGLWATMFFCQKDVAVMSVLLLSWCDTAASTFGRLWGKYTPRIRKGKSLAGSLAAFVFGVLSAVLFWAIIAPSVDAKLNDDFAFKGTLTLPFQIRQALDLSTTDASISGWAALTVLSLMTGLIVSVSEALDIFGLDDNLTIPVLSGAGLGAFLYAFGG